MRKLRVAILTGGPFAEHEGSVLSGKAVEHALKSAEYEVIPVLVKRNGDWSIPPEELGDAADLAFIAMHGKYGEDGMVQDTLSQLGIPYTGSNVLTSALAINKVLTGRLFRSLGFNTPRFVALEKHDSGYFNLNFSAEGGSASGGDFPVIVKPVNRGLSLGVGVARHPEELNNHLHRAFEFSKSVLVEEYIAGRELNITVIDSGNGDIPLIPMEVIPRTSSFHDYYLKHSPEALEVIVPAALTDEERDLVQGAGLIVHQAIGAKGVSKTDMILGHDGCLYLLETNTIPSFTPTGALHRAASAHGLSLAEVCERIIESAAQNIASSSL